jgi:hypothetical protein
MGGILSDSCEKIDEVVVASSQSYRREINPIKPFSFAYFMHSTFCGAHPPMSTELEFELRVADGFLYDDACAAAIQGFVDVAD